MSQTQLALYQALDDGERTEVQMWWIFFSLRREKVKWAD